MILIKEYVFLENNFCIVLCECVFYFYFFVTRIVWLYFSKEVSINHFKVELPSLRFCDPMSNLFLLIQRAFSIICLVNLIWISPKTKVHKRRRRKIKLQMTSRNILNLMIVTLLSSLYLRISCSSNSDRHSLLSSLLWVRRILLLFFIIFNCHENLV